MRKKLLSIALVIGLISVSFVTKAQNGRFSVGAEVAMPMGDFGDDVGVGIGGSLRYELPVSDNLAVMATAGYITFSGKTIDGFDQGSWSMIPIQLGAKYYFSEMQNGFYFGLHLGVHSISYHVPTYSYTDPFSGTTVTLGGGTASATDLSYAPELGYHLANVDFGLRYQIISTTGSSTSYLGLRVAYVFGGK